MTNNEQLRHVPVLLEEVIEQLHLEPGKVYLDVTFGSGGHTRAILEAEPTCSVIALDWDTKALETFGDPLQEEFGSRLTLLWGNFGNLYKILAKNKIQKVDGILADFGTSQVQIKSSAGFSVYRDTPLDMRMSPPHHRITAEQILASAGERELCEIFWRFGEERYAKQIAQAIIKQRAKEPIKTTIQLAKLIEHAVPGKFRQSIHPATRVFQALRIFVNKELDNISSFLATAVRTLNTDGRLVCISFHSLEDRIVKTFMREQKQQGSMKIVTPKPIRAGVAELERNPASRSACLRVGQKI